jgi:alginate O-acetyltransferase complex protein AlgI
MIFATYWFFVFALIFFPVCWLLRWPRSRALWLLAGCATFHAHFAGPAGVVPIIILGLVTYACGLSRRRWLCHGAVALCAAALIFYKYTLFLSANLISLGGHLGWHFEPVSLPPRWLPAAPPLGISFFVFEFVHYLVEVGRGGDPIRRPVHFALFAIFFPSLVAGPIKRYQNFTSQLQAGLAAITLPDIAGGAQRIALGFFKKAVLADNINLALTCYEKSFATLSTGQAWLFLAGLGTRIALDFSGYSDIAIGLARMLGITIPENFHLPYLATNVRDFWLRWHISLSTWIRDYIYIPLGGGCHGLPRKLLNGLVAFALCGLWHGAEWHFVLWGLWHGAGLAISSTYHVACGSTGLALGRFLARFPLLSWLLTLWFVTFGWLLFFYDPSQAWAMATKLLGLH